jgi:hypothetical protein
MSASIAVSIAVLVGFNSSTMASIAQAAEPSRTGATASGKFDPPFPFDVEQLWGKLAQVTAVHGQLITPALIEKIFSVKLKELPENPKNVGKLYGIRAQIDWYYGIGVHIYRDETLFTFGLAKTANEDFCIIDNIVSKTLEQQGWKLHYAQNRRHSLTDVRDYSFGNTTLMAEFSENGCLVDLFVSSHPVGQRSPESNS